MPSDIEEEKMLNALKKKYANQPDEVRKYWDKRIDDEYKRRNRHTHSIADDPADYAKGRHLGVQDPGDISYKEPWQKRFREQTGYSLPYGVNYTCPVCGYTYALDMPPEYCIRCGARSFLHLKKIVNYKC